MVLLKLGDKYSVSRLEAACKKFLAYTPTLSLKSVQTILKTGQDKINLEETHKPKAPTPEGFVRGALNGRNIHLMGVADLYLKLTHF